MTRALMDGITREHKTYNIIIRHDASSELSMRIQQLQQTTKSGDDTGFTELIRVLYDLNNGNGRFVESGIQAAMEKHYKYLRK